MTARGDCGIQPSRHPRRFWVSLTEVVVLGHDLPDRRHERGVYPFCCGGKNGNGELPGTARTWSGSRRERSQIPVNDPSPTNTSGVAAYYAGPAPRAYVSQLNPYNGQTACYPDRVLAQITSQATS